MNSVVFSHLNYTNPSKTFEEYKKLLNEEVKFCKSKKWHKVPKNINIHNLISSHPFWKRHSIKERRKYYYQVSNWVKECKEDESKIKYLFNINETIESLNNKLKEQRIRLYGS